MLNIRVTEVYVVKDMVDESISKSDVQSFGHTEKMENNKISKEISEGKCIGSPRAGRRQKKGIRLVDVCLNKEV